MWKKDWRSEVFARTAEPWDLIIIGGGITGAGNLLESARMGLRALPFEARDFRAGTPARPTKPAHGGLRSSRQGPLRRTPDRLPATETPLPPA